MGLVEAIEFPVFVDGKPMTASVVEEMGDPTQYSYRIQFTDGYEDIFTLDEGILGTEKGDSSKPYVKAIRNDISRVIGLDTNKFYHVFPTLINGIATNVWIIEKEDDDEQTYYGVYYNEEYRFEAREVNNQLVFSTRSKAPDAAVNEDLAQLITPILRSVV